MIVDQGKKEVYNGGVPFVTLDTATSGVSIEA